MSDKRDKVELIKCHHCGHEWEPRVKQPKKCPQCCNSLWKSPSPKKLKVPKAPVDVLAARTSIIPSEENPATLPTTATSGQESPVDVSGVDVVETPLQRARREADERLRRLAHDSTD